MLSSLALDPTDTTGRTYYVTSKARQLLGYAPLVSFRDGAERTVDWLRTEGPRYFPTA